MKATIVCNYNAAFLGHMKFFIEGEDNPRHVIPCSNQTINGGYGQYGHCPPGEYGLADPQARDQSDGYYYDAEGAYFTALVDIHGLWSQAPVPDGVTRSEIGVHSEGRINLPVQPLHPTEGCHRIHNQDNSSIFVPFVRWVKSNHYDLLLRVVDSA